MDKKNNKKQEEPEIYAINNNTDKTKFTRKKFLGTIGAVGAGLLLAPNTTFADRIRVNNYESLYGFHAHKEIINQVAISVDGKILASVSNDKTIKLWSVPEGKKIIELTKHEEKVLCVQFSPDGKFLASGSATKLILWDLKNFESVSVQFTNAQKLVFSPDCKTLITSYMNLEVWNYEKNILQKKHTIKGSGRRISDIDINPFGDALAVATSADKKVIIYSMKDFSQKKTLFHKKYISAVKYSPNGKYLATGGYDKKIHIYNLINFELKKTWSAGNTYNIKKIDFSKDSKYFCYIDSIHNIKFQNIDNYKDKKRFYGDNSSILDFAVSPDNEFIISAGRGKGIWLNHLIDNKQIFVIFDPDATRNNKMKEVKQIAKETKEVPCNTPIPNGATCICDCVAQTRSFPGTKDICTCNTVSIPYKYNLAEGQTCVCDTVKVGNYSPPKSYGGGGGSYTRTYWYPN